MRSMPSHFSFLGHAHCYVPISKADCCIVADQPEIILHPENHTISERDNVTLSCNATGNPEPTISWTRNGYQFFRRQKAVDNNECEQDRQWRIPMCCEQQHWK